MSSQTVEFGVVIISVAALESDRQPDFGSGNEF